MSTVRPFNKERILEYIKNNDLRHLTDADGDYLVRFGNNGISFDCYMLAGGSRGEVLTLMASRQKQYDRKQWAACMEACNDWNQGHRWPGAYLRITDDSAQIVCEWHVDLEKGVHQELMEDMIDTFIGSTHQFWLQMRDERGLY